MKIYDSHKKGKEDSAPAAVKTFSSNVNKGFTCSGENSFPAPVPEKVK